jgi:hypothetical protein
MPLGVVALICMSCSTYTLAMESRSFHIHSRRVSSKEYKIRVLGQASINSTVSTYWGRDYPSSAARMRSIQESLSQERKHLGVLWLGSNRVHFLQMCDVGGGVDSD